MVSTKINYVRFDEALKAAIFIATSFIKEHKYPLALVRNDYGKIRFIVDDRGSQPPTDALLKGLASALNSAVGVFGMAEDAVSLATSSLHPNATFLDKRGLQISPMLKLLEHSPMGSDWTQEPLLKAETRRVTFFGIKGGVGRSSAAGAWAWHLANRGKRVLIIDLDLESPGLSTTLLHPDKTPDFGVVDWFVEDAVGQADERFVRDLVAKSPLSSDTDGDIRIVTSGGRTRPGYFYLPKLSRCYKEINDSDFASRLDVLIKKLEATVKPDVTFLDSRAGLHDIAAACITRLNAFCLLFAIDTAQTWDGYGTIFSNWREHQDRARAFRDNLRIVAAQVPETESQTYLENFKINSYKLFQENLYEEAEATDLAAFNFDLNVPDAPHHPLRINWSRALQQFDPVRQPNAVTSSQIEAAYGDFFKSANQLIFGKALP
ncbi:KGGVGR-motif variant AAA ATPase [Corallococcus interemptor]|uniref:KGGVGR-motif variant AAA ATPase n=1 Tax=Corallococcus interemptor TaxID=2316720 RepID=UPI003D0315BD